MKIAIPWKPVVIGVAAGLAVIALAVVARAVLGRTTDGEWLGFAGGIFGVTLTIGATKLIDWLISDAKEKRRKAQFMLAMRSIATGLKELADGDAARIPELATATVGLWRVANPLIDTLPELDFDQRAKIGLVEIALNDNLSNLLSNAMLTKVTPGLVEGVRAVAEKLRLTVHSITEMFDKKERWYFPI